MEVLGAVAATGQLIGTGFAIIDSINQLRDFLNHAPARCQGWRTQLDILGETICNIRQSPLLQTCQVGRIIDGMAPKINTLTELCALYTPQSKKMRLYRRIRKAISAKGIETRILQNFQSLEQDKTSLILTIGAMNGSNSSHHQTKPEEMVVEKSNGSACAGGEGIHSPNSSKPRVSSIPKENEQNSLVCVPPKIPPDIIEILTTEPQPTTRHNTMPQTIDFSKIDNEGNNCLIGTTSTHGASPSSGTKFHEIKNRGIQGVIGVHQAELVKRYAPPSPPQTDDQTHGHRLSSSNSSQASSYQPSESQATVSTSLTTPD